MALSVFIRTNLEPILQEWETFAGTLLPLNMLDTAVLRDHAQRMLETIAADLERPQTAEQKDQKSKGRAPPSLAETAAGLHGADRRTLGLQVHQLAAEYRALRASVIRLWSVSITSVQQSDFDEIIRFNEAIDQALAESITHYYMEKEQQSRLFNTILSNSPDHSYILDLEKKIIYANEAMTDLFGIPLNRMIGKSFVELGVPLAEDIEHGLQILIDTKKTVHGEMTYAVPPGETKTYECIFAPVISADGKVEAIAGTARDITERKAWEQHIWNNANYDFLTNLPNRRLFLDRLDQGIRHAERIGLPLVLLFVDLDHFKAANDMLGHEGGDLLLFQAADRIHRCVRETDTVARIGGDEFTVILTEIKQVTHVGVLVQEIVDELARPFAIHDATAQISASVGVALFPYDGATPEDLMKNADHAMYAAKNAGGNSYRFFADHVQQT
jgi:diguanylate cyclase (GGDEF)-like protein/PAS domain S-box-containing protein